MLGLGVGVRVCLLLGLGRGVGVCLLLGLGGMLIAGVRARVRGMLVAGVGWVRGGGYAYCWSEGLGQSTATACGRWPVVFHYKTSLK